MQLKNLILFSILTLSNFSGFANEIDDSDAEKNFTQGQIFYENDEYDEAMNEFTLAISKSPNNSMYHHWLAKSYGELAETSGWFKAMRLAKNSKESLLRAVELDPENISALTDLMKYYQEAPRFLGGSNKKAKEIKVRLENLEGKKPESTSVQQPDYEAQNG
jgi:tetratricopeptide (TPR) repeat protein